MNVSLSSDSEFITKLSKVVEANLADENFGVKELARKTKISRTQLHRKIKSINNQSVSQFIREIRLNRAKELLQQDLGTVSEIAYKVGFGSPSYFIKCFHEYFGYPPGVLLKLHPEQQEEDEKITELSKTTLKKVRTFQKVIFFKLFIGFLGILTIVIMAIFIYRDFNSGEKTIIQDNSIAVLPLKNLSDNLEIQHLADGIMEDILNRLSHVQELEVKSRISSEQFRNPDLSIPEIGKEMKVSYLLEGRIMSQGDKVRIYVQLIDAKTDNHFWSDEYNQDLTDIFDFTSNVSRQIADQLQITLTTGEISNIKKNYTEDKEAYNLYLLGRYFWHRKTSDDILRCVDYFKQAITKDSNYALAYAGLSDAYNTLASFRLIPFEEGVQGCKKYAEKAIRIDPNLAEGHASLGDCASDYLWDWELAEKEFKLAIELNPNLALVYRYYADYLIVMGRNDEAKRNLDKSIELDPLSMATYLSYGNLYYNEGNFEEVLRYLELRWGFGNNPKSEHFAKFKVNLLQDKGNIAIDELKQYILLDSPGADYSEELDKLFAESGMKGVMQWFVEYYILHEADNFQIASFYVYLEEEEKAIDYLEKQYNNKEKRYLMKLIKNDYDYKTLHGHPRFIALLKKMNFADK